MQNETSFAAIVVGGLTRSLGSGYRFNMYYSKAWPMTMCPYIKVRSDQVTTTDSIILPAMAKTMRITIPMYDYYEIIRQDDLIMYLTISKHMWVENWNCAVLDNSDLITILDPSQTADRFERTKIEMDNSKPFEDRRWIS